MFTPVVTHAFVKGNADTIGKDWFGLGVFAEGQCRTVALAHSDNKLDGRLLNRSPRVGGSSTGDQRKELDREAANGASAIL